MDAWEHFDVSGEAAGQFLRYRLAVIAAFLLAVAAAAFAERAWHGPPRYDAIRVEARR